MASFNSTAMTAKPFYWTDSPDLLSFIPDLYLSLAAPVIVYWVMSLFFHVLDMSDWAWLDKYRIHESKEVLTRNRVSRKDVVLAVILQHLIQTLLGIAALEPSPAIDPRRDMADMYYRLGKFLMMLSGGDKHAASLWARFGPQITYNIYWWFIPSLQFFAAMLVMDTWQYFLHRAMHVNKFLYKHLHSVHHRLYVPYAFGALYNHPLEGFLLDSVGTLIAHGLTGMSVRQDILLFSFATCKTVDDHCGYSLPGDPLQMLSGNTADYHDIHHQQIGIKSNFSQPFFIHWDVILGTRMTRKDIEDRRATRKPAKDKEKIL